MTAGYWLKTATGFLQSKSITTARLDCLVLLEDTLRVDRAQLLAEPTTEISAAQVAHLQKLLSRRAKHEPLAYIRGRCEFYGRTFTVSHAVMVPRPESEAIIDLCKDLVAPEYQNAPKTTANGSNNPTEAKPSHGIFNGLKTLKIADVGSGSGALGITAALELPNCQVDLLELDAVALKIAKTNVDKFTLDISVINSDLLTNAPSHYQILLCNLPYVPDDYAVNKAARHEPKLALFGGVDGLDLYRKLFEQIRNSQNQPLFILTESFPSQHQALSKIATNTGFKLVKTADLVQLFQKL